VPRIIKAPPELSESEENFKKIITGVINVGIRK